jgi:AbrB family looped-hinge helix DNA binding protein
MTKMTTKEQMTIPSDRDRRGIKPGSEVDFELAEDGRVFIKIKALHRPPESVLRACAAAPNSP